MDAELMLDHRWLKDAYVPTVKPLKTKDYQLMVLNLRMGYPTNTRKTWVLLEILFQMQIFKNTDVTFESLQETYSELNMQSFLMN